MSHKGSWLSGSADVNFSTSGDKTVIAAVAGKKIIVWKMWLVSGGAVNLIFKDGSTAFNAAAIPLTANGSSITFAFDSEPYWITSAGSAFVMNLDSSTQVTGRIYYSVQD